MNSELLLALYGRVADASDGIMRLRRFILDLAVQGKLVSQCPEDEPILRHLKNALGSSRKDLSAFHDAAPVDIEAIPSSWAWLPLGAIIGEMNAGWSPQCEAQSRDSAEQWAVLKTTAVQQLVFDATQNKRLPHRLKPRPEHQAEVGDILVTRAGPKNRVGISCVVDVPCPRLMISDKLIRFHPLGNISSRYIALALNAGRTLREIEHAKSGMAVMQMNISQDKLRSVMVPVPPVVEQRRIVAKVDELMALCDQLEEARADRETRRNKLTAATLGRLSTPKPETFRNDARFALDNLQALTTRPDQIKQLRQTVLTLAVRGRLVSQEAVGETSVDLLRRIAIDFEQRVQGGKLNKQKSIEPLPRRDLPFPLPPSWSWARFNQIAAIQSNLVDPKRYPMMPHIAPDNIEGWTGRLLPYSTIAEAGVFSGKHHFSAGSLLYSKIRPNLAKVTKVDFEGLCSADMYPIHALIDRDFLLYFMISEDFVKQAVSEDNRVAMPKINQAALSNILVPVPPLSEQRRVAAMVTELLVLCEELQRVLSVGDAARVRVLEALLAESLEPEAQRDGAAARQKMVADIELQTAARP